MKIIFKDITIRNFLSFGNNYQKFSFKEGVNIITGTNGVGKSALSDSLSFCLFGKVLRDINQDDLINWRNRKDCVVEGAFSKGDTDYKIIRGLRPYFLEIYEDGKVLEKIGKRDTQTQVEEILGFSFNTYSNLVYTNINFNTPIMKMARGQKREFIEKLFNIEVFTQLSEKCKNKLKNMEKRKAVIKARKGAIDSLVTEYDKIISEYEAELLETTTAKDSLNKFNAEKAELEKYFIYGIKDKIEQDIEVLENNYKIENERLSNFKFKIRTINAEINKIENRIELLKEENKCPTCDNKIDPTKLTEKFLKKIKKLEETRETTESNKTPLIAEINKIEKQLGKKKIEQKECHEKFSRLLIVKAEIEHLEKAINESEQIKHNIQIKIDEYIDKKNKLLKEKLDLQIEKNRINSIQDYVTYVKDACRDENVKQHAISSIIPFINKFTNEYLAQVGFNFFVEVDKFIDAKIKGPGIFGESASNLSGGESKSIDMSLMMAFHDVGRMKAKNFADIIFLDEILDSSVDSINISKIYDIIRTKQKKDNLKVYIISHRPEIQDFEFDNVIKIKKENGFTRVIA